MHEIAQRIGSALSERVKAGGQMHNYQALGLARTHWQNYRANYQAMRRLLTEGDKAGADKAELEARQHVERFNRITRESRMSGYLGSPAPEKVEQAYQRHRSKQ